MKTNKIIPTGSTISYLLVAVVLLAVNGKADDADEPISIIRKLRKDLMSQYDKYARPVKKASTSVPVWITIHRLALVELNEVEQKIVIDAVMLMHWMDEHLRWNPNEYNGIDLMLFEQDEIWRPDIVLYKSAPTTNNIPWNNTHMFAYHSGMILWEPPSSISVRCPMPLLKPMEERICNVTMASYLHLKHEVDLKLEQDLLKVDDSKRVQNDNPFWKLTQIYPSLRTTSFETFDYSVATFSFHIKRRYDFVGDALRGPRTVAILLTLTMFWIPPTSNKKLNMGCLMLLIISGIILFLSSTLISPSLLAETVAPLRITLFTIISAMLIEVIIINLARFSDIIKPPPTLIRILSGMVGRIIGVCSRLEYKAEDQMVRLPPETEEEEISQPTITVEEEWDLVAMALDRLFFIIYAATFIIISYYN